MCLAIPGKIISIKEGGPLERIAKVSFGGSIIEVNLSFTPEATVDDYVVVHVGFALSVVDEAEAERVFEDLKQISATAQESDSFNDESFNQSLE